VKVAMPYQSIRLLIDRITIMLAGRLFVGWDGVVIGITTCQGLQGRDAQLLYAALSHRVCIIGGCRQ
jgi:hypothetical protein